MAKKIKEQEKPFDGYKWLSQFAAHDDARPVLNMIYIDGGDKAGHTCERVAVAADGFRLGVIPVADDMPVGFMPIPKGKTTVKDVEGSNFPNWDMILPKDVPFSLEVNTAQLYAALKTGRGIGDNVWLLWEPNNSGMGTLYLYFSDPVDGDMVVSLLAGLSHGVTDKLQIAVNTKYLLETLTGWDDQTTLLGIIKEDKPITVEPKRAGFNHPMALIMPMHIYDSGVWTKVKELEANKPQFSQWNGQGNRFDAIPHYQTQSDEEGRYGMWHNQTPKAEWKDVHAACSAHVIPDSLVQDHIRLTHTLENMGWDKTRCRSAGRMIIKGKLSLNDKEKKLIPTIDSDEYSIAIRRAACSCGMVRTDEQRIKAERITAGMKLTTPKNVFGHPLPAPWVSQASA